ncbi:MAG: hypothetical protein WC717_05400 [Candidatus Micrarchaeia archaeon]|jgi:hypothetical protein
MEEPDSNAVDGGAKSSSGALLEARQNDVARNAYSFQQPAGAGGKSQAEPIFLQPQQEEEQFKPLRQRIDMRLPDQVVGAIIEKFGGADVPKAFIDRVNAAAGAIFGNAGKGEEQALASAFGSSQRLRSLLINMPEEMAELSGCAGSGTARMLNYLSNPNNAKALEQHMGFYLEITKHAGADADRAFRYIPTARYGELVKPFEGQLARVAAAAGTGSYMAFMAIFDFDFYKAQGTYGHYKVDLGTYGMFRENPEEFARAAELHGKDAQVYFKLAAIYGALPTDAEIQKKAEVFLELGLDWAEMGDREILDNVYLTATGQAQMEGRKLAFVVITKDDAQGSFTGDQALYHSLMEQGYNLIICQAGNEDEVAERFFNYGRLAKDSGKNGHFRQAGAHLTYDFAIFGAHGTFGSMGFGATEGEKSEIDLSDYDEMRAKGDWESMMSKNAVALLHSCSTGYESELGKEGRFQNIRDMIGPLLNRDVFAPRIESHVHGLVFDESGYVGDVVWREDRHEGGSGPRTGTKYGAPGK